MSSQSKVRFCLIALGVLMQVGLLEASEIVANPMNSESIDAARLKLMLTGKEKFWKTGDEVLIAILKSDDEVQGALAKYSGMTPNKFLNHWQRMAFSGRGKMPKMFSKVEDLIKFVESNDGAIGIVATDSSADGLRRVTLGGDFPVKRSRFLVWARRSVPGA